VKCEALKMSATHHSDARFEGPHNERERGLEEMELGEGEAGGGEDDDLVPLVWIFHR
jgi:hypothetical protein